jgi:hypothetical protein
MDIQKAKIVLQKINRHFDVMAMDRHVSKIEHDLMLQYVRDFYETLSEPTTSQPETPATKVKQAEAPPLEAEYRPAPPVREQRKPETPPPAKEVAPTPPPPPTYVPPTPPPAADETDNGAHDLFEHKEAKEISEKLGQSPIKDLSKSMGINDRLHTINELFGGDTKYYDYTVSVLNGLGGFEEAKQYLLDNVASKYDWTNKLRKEKAKEFIKLVRRRFLQ